MTTHKGGIILKSWSQTERGVVREVFLSIWKSERNQYVGNPGENATAVDAGQSTVVTDRISKNLLREPIMTSYPVYCIMPDKVI